MRLPTREESEGQHLVGAPSRSRSRERHRGLSSRHRARGGLRPRGVLARPELGTEAVTAPEPGDVAAVASFVAHVRALRAWGARSLAGSDSRGNGERCGPERAVITEMILRFRNAHGVVISEWAHEEGSQYVRYT